MALYVKRLLKLPFQPGRPKSNIKNQGIVNETVQEYFGCYRMGNPHEAMIHRAFELALNNQAQLCFIEVMEEIPKELQNYFKDITSKDFQEIAFRENLSRLQEILGPFSREGFQHVTNVLIGKPFRKSYARF